ncbi:hypothetical protein KVV02_002609 [Mortierella alpina]|uniref:Uncharacterized protein n=1 Tax=Mortierella alpina TaxID=64518 RepID=A0A9P8A1E3_MORAP|nr:hypothetical protein KVV02_002609 [Mortierella alpina]
MRTGMILESPPLVNVTPLAAIHEVPIHIRHPIQPNSASKHRRLGLLMLNELARVEMLVARIEAAGKHEDTSAELKRTVAHLEQTLFAYEVEKKPAGNENSSGRMLLQRYMTRTGLDEMFPKSSEYLGIDPVIPGGSFIEGMCAPVICSQGEPAGRRRNVNDIIARLTFDLFIAHFRQMSSINQLVSIALQVQNDLRLSNHKFIAHQVALLYQCINQAGPQFSKKYKSRVEENFSLLKETASVSDTPFLPIDLQAWLSNLTTDIVAEALFSGRPMSQQTPEAAHLSNYINRVSSGNAPEVDNSP